MGDRISNAIEHALAWAVAAVLGGVWWLIRRVFTNQQQIELMQADLRARDRQRCEDRERMANIERGVDRIESKLMADRD